MSDHRKQLQRFHDPGDIHELTFSVYRREKLLTNNAWRRYLSESITQSCQENRCFLAAFVYMPEHVHLLIWGIQSKEQVSDFLAAAKQPMSGRVRSDLEATESLLLDRLLIQERVEKQVFRFWQVGVGYDRNLKTVKAVQASIDYIHHNPVARGLCRKAVDWRWSSARYYASDGEEIDSLHPLITPLPREFWLGGW
jgi:putative transposase